MAVRELPDFLIDSLKNRSKVYNTEKNNVDYMSTVANDLDG
jgi:hypothetical protein